VINQARDAGVGQEAISKAQDLLSELMRVFGLHLEKPTDESAQAAPFIDLLVQLRRELRQEKLWALADSVRNRLLALGVILEDTRDGTAWRWQ
jgi:cysteinyl-tRNA synthetase